MAGRIYNVHERVVATEPAQVNALLERLGGPDDPLWPAPAWEPMILDGPPVMGADGGHGPIRYRVTAAEPGRIRFEFHSVPGIDGYHELTVEPAGPGAARVRHVLDCRLSGWMRLVGPAVIEPQHDAVLEDLLDNVERQVTGTVARPARWTPLVRILRITERPTVRAVDVPAAATLARRVQTEWGDGPGTLVDAFAVRRAPGQPGDPQLWADAIFRNPPRWVTVALALRQALVGLIGIEKGTAESFATVARTDDEVLLGEDAGHLRFRASVLVGSEVVTVSTVAAPSNLRGRAYLAVVRVLHPVVIRGMLRRAAIGTGERVT